MASLGTAALTALVLAAAPVPAAAASREAHVWLTTPDGEYRMADLGSVAFTTAEDGAGAGPGAVPTIVVDTNRKFQEMSGFGASITESSAAVLYRLDPHQRAAV